MSQRVADPLCFRASGDITFHRLLEAANQLIAQHQQLSHASSALVNPIR
jgi:hypothetical protein